jgi:hypothetical protein
MPPHALRKSPLSRFFMLGGAGEWSEEMRSMMPSVTPWMSFSLLAAPLMGGAHLYSVAPSGMSSEAKVR